MKINNILIGILVFTLLLAAGCSNDTDASSSDDEIENVEKKEEKEKEEATNLGDYHIDLSGDIKEENDQFIVEGKSNLIPNTRIVGEVVVDDGETIYSNTTELVGDDGSFYMELDHHQYGEAEIIIRVDFESVQDDEVKRHYGEKGQKFEGPFIYKHDTFDGILKKAEVNIAYVPGETNNLTIAAPEWYDLPEDYGDPRVWIEIEEITEDGEFFYVHGRSNILEGSEIKVEYKYNRDKTQVKPDGSFDFKFDYEYLEDREIVITFDPSSWQWNEIEEAYGSTGQKLIGNLVVSDKYNTDKQYIEKRIPWDNDAAQGDNQSEVSDEGSTNEDEVSETDDVEKEE